MAETEEIQLNEKQKIFCNEYLLDLNATKAAIRAGYSQKTAGSIGSENLKKPELRAYIAKLMDERSKRTLVDQEFIIQNLIEVSQRCMQKRPVMIFDPVEKTMVQKKEYIDDEEKDVWDFDSNGANRSLELLGKHLKMFTDKIEQKGELTIKSVEVTVRKTGLPQINSEKDIV